MAPGKVCYHEQMSFLESSTNPESQSRIIVREFKDPFCFSSSSQQENNNKASLVPSRNKWTSTDLTSSKRRSVNVDTNNNTNSRKNLSSNRNSSCTISFDELHGGRDEINTISEKDKPILKLWAQKNKSNAAVKDANRSSYLGTPNDAKKVLGQISGTPWGKYLKTNSGKDTMTDSNKQDSRSTARRSDIMITTRSVRKGPQVETKVRPKSAYYEKTTKERLQKREIPIDIDDKNPTQNPSKDVNNNNNRTTALKRSSKIIIRSNSTAKEPPAPSVKTVIRTNSTATLDNKHVKVERKDSAERPKVNTTPDRADHKENVAISSSINDSKELLESEQAENTKHCKTASVDSSEPEQNQDIETREQSNTGNKPTPPKTLAKPKPPSSKKTVEYHNSFLDDLDDLESEINQQLMGTNKQPPPPVPRRSSSKTSELTDFLKKLNDQEEKSSTPKLTRATTLTSPSTTTVITTATMTSTINSVITQNLSRTLPPTTTTTTPSNEQEQKTTSNDNVEEKQSFKDTLAEYDVISSQSDEASENEAVKSNNIDPPNETYVDMEGKCVYAAPESTSLSEDRQLNKKESETNQRTDDNNSCHIINNVRNLFNDNTITKTHYDVNSFSTYIGKPEDEIINTTAQIDFVNNGGREQISLADQKRFVSRTSSYDKKLRQLRTRSFSSADLILLRRYNSVNDDPTTLYRSLTPEDERRKSVDFTRLVSATPWRNSKSSASPTDEKPSSPTGEKNFPTNEKNSVTNSKSILTAKETAAKVVLRSKSSNGIITTKEPLLNKHSRRRFSESFLYDNLLNHRQEVIPSTAFIRKQVDIDFESTANKTIDSVNTSELNLIKEETTINSYTDIESQITGLVIPPNQHQTHDNKDQVRNTRPLSFTRRKSSYTDVFYTTAELKEEDSEIVLSAVPPAERRHIEIENESTTNFSSNFVNNEQPCRQPDAFEKKQQNHKQNVADVNGISSSEDQSMSGRYYTTSTRSSNKYNSYYDRQHDPVFKTSSLSTNLSRRNNESANMSDKHFVGRKNSLDSQNDFPSSTHIKSRYERSYSLNEDYSSKYNRPYLSKVSRRASEDTSNIVDTSYVPKSAYLRQRLQEIQTSKDRGKPASRIRDNSLSSEDSSTSTPRRKTSLKTEDKIDEFIRNHRERRSTERRLSNSSSSSSYNSTSPPYSPVKTSSAKSSFTYISNNSKTSLTSSSRNNCLDNSSLEEEKEKVLNCKNSTTNHIQESNLLSNGHLRKDEYKSITPPPDTLKNFKSINPINTSYTEDQKKLEIKPIIANQESKEHKEDEMRRGSLKDVKDAVVRRFAGSSDSKKIKEVQEEAPSDIQESPFDKNAITSKNEKDNKPSKGITVTTKTNRFGKEKTFGSITRITSSKISTATDLKSFSSSKKKDKQKHDAKTEDQASPSKDENDVTTTSQDTQEPKQKFSRFSLKKKKSVDQTPALPSSPKQEPKQRKHSLTHVFSKHKKEKDDITSPTSPLSPNEDSPVTSPTHNKERRGSAFSRLFSHKKHDQPEPAKEEKKTSKKTTPEKVKAPVEDVPKTPTKQPSPELDATSPNTSLSIPGANLNGSSESLYSDNDYGEPSTRRSSRNKERIRNRKLAKKEAAERHKSLPAGLEELQIDLEKGLAVPVSNNNTITGKESPSVTDATPRTRKKHRARRSNTEFLGNVPLISVEQASPLISKDDATVNRRNNRRNRRDRPKTLMNGLDSDVFNQGDENGGNEVVNENLSFSDIKKKLLEGLTDDKKIPEKVSSKERQKIKRTKSTKRYKTITEGIAPRDLELARQAIEAEKSKTDENGTSRNTIDKSTLDQITAALTSTGDKRKSFIVESRPASRYQSNEDLRISDDEDDKKSKDDSVIKPPATSRRMLQRTKSMTTLHLDTKAEVDADEPEIKPLSELKNRFLQAMEDTQQKHVNYKQSPVEVRRRARRDRKDRPHTICGIDQLTMGQLNDDKKEQEEKDNHRMEQIKNEINEVKQREEADRQARKEALTRPRRGSLEEKPKKREKKKYTRAQSEKIFNDIDDDLEDLLADGLNESDLADILGVNPSLAKDPFVPKAKKELDLEIKGNAEIKKAKELVEPAKTETEPEEHVVNGTTNGEPLSDLDFVSSKSSQLSSSLANDKRKLRPNRKQRSGANPMKSLQNRDDLINEVAVADKQKEQRMNKIDLQSKFLRKNDLADEAISALRATVDFSKTKLRKVEVNKKTMADDVLDESFKPTEFENVLVQVKGRRKCQTTLVDFNTASLNSNDCYIVCTPTNILCWNGSQANVIERSKAAEVASRINQKKEMGCKALDVVYLDQGSANENKVLRLLGGGSVNSKAAVVPDEDFEKAMISAYMTYVVCETSDPPVLIPLDSQCHRMPTKEILQTDSAFIFDFITEVYVWLGRQTKSEQRRIVQKLAAEKFAEGYYKLNMEQKNPALSRVTHTNTGAHASRKISVTAETLPNSGRRGSKPQGGRRASVSQGRHQKKELVQRPSHSLLLQLFEGSEWVIFKEKFCDWPDESRIIRMKGGASAVGEVTKEVSTEIQIQPVDVATMIPEQPLTKMVLDNMDIGRGRGIPKGMDGYHVITLDVKTWHVHENQSILLPDESFGQFHSGEGYVIRWQYRIVKVRALRNCDDVMKAGGMERCCYFFWLGNDCSVNEEGATAVMTIELDREKGPQIRVVLGKEPPALLQLFDGSMIIHAGKRPVNGVRREYSDKSLIRLYCVRNEEEAEACLLQVPASYESLRSRTSFVLLLCEQGEVLLWHGCKSNEGTRKAAEHAVQNLIQNHPEEASIADKSEIGLVEIEEGEEPEVFWMALGGREEYGSLLEDTKDYSNLSPRLFHMESQTGQFVAHEITSPSKSALHNCPFPILQDDLYNVEQPAIFMVDAIETVYLWFGWWPDDEEGTEASNSRRRRWDEERRKAMESAVSYAKEVGRSLDFMYAVYAGLEPEGFIELFPYWVVQEDITELQLDEGIEEEEIYNITEELEMFSKEFYTIEELREKPPPKGVDPTKLEKYLSEEDFLAVFNFSKDTFMKLPGWQQVNWKKKLDLY